VDGFIIGLLSIVSLLVLIVNLTHDDWHCSTFVIDCLQFWK